MSEQTNDKNYEVGYGRPPKHTRFKPGQSGNPNGRQKGARNFDTLLKKELESKISGTDENGNRIVMTKKEALVKKLTNGALKGEHRAIALLLQQLLKQEGQDLKKPVEDDCRDVDWGDAEAAEAAWREAQKES